MVSVQNNTAPQQESLMCSALLTPLAVFWKATHQRHLSEHLGQGRDWGALLRLGECFLACVKATAVWACYERTCVPLQVGDEGAGHFVKMVHNGIEYGDMQLICEAYHLMKDVLGMDHDEMAKVSCLV